MDFVLFDDETRFHLLPLTFTRPVCDIRLGIFTIREKWEKKLQAKSSSLTEAYLQEKFPVQVSDDNLLINGSYLPDDSLVAQIVALKKNEALAENETLIAARVDADLLSNFNIENCINKTSLKNLVKTPKRISRLWEIFSKNSEAIEEDFLLATKGRTTAIITANNRIKNREKIFMEEGADVDFAVLNASGGSVYIGKNALVMEGAKIRGPVSIGDQTMVKMDARIYGGTTIGPGCRVGGEINNSVLFGNSNKAHDGYLGNAVLGEWCNLGADTNNSNLRNDYANVKMWDYAENDFVNSGLQFCGLVMGDHSKCSINTMFNTGTVVGVFANIFGAGFPANLIPSFSWGSPGAFVDYRIEKALKVAELVMQRRGITLTEADRKILTYIYNQKIK